MEATLLTGEGWDFITWGKVAKVQANEKGAVIFFYNGAYALAFGNVRVRKNGAEFFLPPENEVVDENIIVDESKFDPNAKGVFAAGDIKRMFGY